MALVAEDGSGTNPAANSYIDRAGVIAYAADRGVTLANDTTTDAKAFGAMDYLMLFASQWKGTQTNPGVQPLPWARKNVYIDNVLQPDDVIPGLLLRAQAELVLQINAGVNLLPTLSGQTAFVTREKVDVLETEYSEAIALELLGALPNMPLVEALLGPLLATVPRLRTQRI